MGKIDELKNFIMMNDINTRKPKALNKDAVIETFMFFVDLVGLKNVYTFKNNYFVINWTSYAYICKYEHTSTNPLERSEIKEISIKYLDKLRKYLMRQDFVYDQISRPSNQLIKELDDALITEPLPY